MEELRRVKSSKEIIQIRRACAITKRVLALIPKLLKPGITERALALKIYVLSVESGAEALAFETIVAFGSNTSRPHHHPTNRPFKRGDLVQIDMGVKVNGYCSDYSRVFFTGPKTPKQQKAYQAILQAKKAAKAAAKPGASTRTLDRIARAELKKFGFSKEFSHALGHGVGLEVHEVPVLSAKAPDVKLKKGEVIAIEPGLYFAGEWGMRVEDTVMVEE